MGIRSLIQIAVTLALLAVSTGSLPLILKEVRKAQLELLEESKASKWGRVLIATTKSVAKVRLLHLNQHRKIDR